MADGATAGTSDGGDGRSRPAWALDGGASLTPSERRKWTRYWVQLLRARLVASVVLSATLAALPALGPNRFLAAAIALVAGVTVNLALIRRVRRGLAIRTRLAFSDLGTVVAVIALAPAAYAAGVILIVSMTAFFTFWFGGSVGRWINPSIGVALAVVGVWRQPDLWIVMWLAWFTTASLGAVAIGRMARVSAEVRNRYDDMVNGLDAMVWEAPGAVGDADYVSGRVTDLLGFDPADMGRFSFLASHVHPDDLADVIDSRRRLAEGRDVEVQYRLRDASGRQHHLHERVTVARAADGAVTNRRGVIVDETARWLAESNVRRYVDFIEGIPLALAILRLEDPDEPSSLRVVVGNPAAAALVGLAPEQVVDRRLVEMVPVSERLLDRLADVARSGGALEVSSVSIGEDDAVYALRAMPLPDQCLGISLEDVTKRARLAESLRHQALHDHLTGLPNRARLTQRMSTALERAAGSGARTGLLLMDLNQFKEVNDSLGHEFGDRLLVELAGRMSRGLRGCDTIARLGGDEFAVLLTDVPEPDVALGVARRLVQLCEEPFVIGDFRLRVGASVGVALAPDHAADATELMRHADAAMYRAKEDGGGIVVHGSEDTRSSPTRFELLGELGDAVDSDELEVHYQPRVDLRTMDPVGVEALVRWRHPRHGLLHPGAFIELAEVSGTIEQLTRRVTLTAARELTETPGADALQLDVNLSARNLRDPLLLEWVLDVVESTGLPAESLCFELTEPQLVEDPDTAMEVLHRLHHLGVRLAVDDFGTGASPMAFLRELPIDQVKIDGRFVGDLRHGDGAIARSVIDLGHNLGMHVVAEGVECPTTVTLLREIGCDSAQGYHLAPPMPIDDLRAYLEDPAAAARVDLSRLGRPNGAAVSSGPWPTTPD